MDYSEHPALLPRGEQPSVSFYATTPSSRFVPLVDFAHEISEAERAVRVGGKLPLSGFAALSTSLSQSLSLCLLSLLPLALSALALRKNQTIQKIQSTRKGTKGTVGSFANFGFFGIVFRVWIYVAKPVPSDDEQRERERERQRNDKRWRAPWRRTHRRRS